MKRREIELSIDHVAGATPSMAGLQALLSKQFDIDSERIEIKNIFSLKGRSRSKSKTFIWDEKKVADLSKPKEEATDQAQIKDTDKKVGE